MFAKIVLTLAVILGAYLIIRARLRLARGHLGPAPPTRPPRIAPVYARALAYGLLTVMVGGSLWWLYLDWEHGQGVVGVQVINVNTGAIARYEARRSAIEGRRFTTLDGRQVTLAEVERLVLE
jgi:hypothetical protein